MRNVEKYLAFDKRSPNVKKYLKRVLAGDCNVTEGAKLAGVNRESFRRFVKEEQAKLAAKESDKK